MCHCLWELYSQLRSDWIVFYAVSAIFQPDNGGLQSKINDIDNVSLSLLKSILKCESIRSSYEIERFLICSDAGETSHGWCMWPVRHALTFVKYIYCEPTLPGSPPLSQKKPNKQTNNSNKKQQQQQQNNFESLMSNWFVAQTKSYGY